MRRFPCSLLSVLAVMLVPGLLLAQNIAPHPSHSFVLSGYGTAGWFHSNEQPTGPNGFSLSFSPILLFRITDRTFAEAELEFELEEGATRTGLEYGAVHYLANDYLTISAGKFLLPFGVFGQRLHPSWINRFNSMPPLYGHHGGIAGNDPLTPILSDIGIMASVVLPLGDLGRNLILSAYVTNGPQVEAAEEAHAALGASAMGEEEHGHLPEFGFGEFSQDNNDNKMIGGRVGLVLAPDLEIDVSALWSRWGAGEVGVNEGHPLHYNGYNLAAEYRPWSHLELRTEWAWLRTDVEEVEETASIIETLRRFGGYAQAAYRVGAWEPVFRFSLVDQNQDMADDQLTQYGFGLNYWFSPSVAIMAGFEVNRDKFDDGADLPNDRFLIHWAFGF